LKNVSSSLGRERERKERLTFILRGKVVGKESF